MAETPIRDALIQALDAYLRQDETAGDTDNNVYRRGQAAMSQALSAPPPAGAQQAVADERAAFEADYMRRFNKPGYLGRDKEDRFEHAITQVRWEGWQARSALAAPAAAEEAGGILGSVEPSVVLCPNGEPWDDNPDGIVFGQDRGPRMNPDTGFYEGGEADDDGEDSEGPTDSTSVNPGEIATPGQTAQGGAPHPSTPHAGPAAAQGQLDGTARIRCRKCGEDVTVEWNCAHIKSPTPSCCGQTPCVHPGAGPCNRPAAIKKAVAEAALETNETGPTVKEAWWAGAREGLGLPADTPRSIAGQRLRALAATPAPEAAPVEWGDPKTVGMFIRQLQTIAPETPIHAAVHTDLDGKRVALTKPVTISRERVAGRRIRQGDETVPYSIVVWAQQDELAAPSAKEGEAPMLLATAPEHIWLDLGAAFMLGDPTTTAFHELGDVTWSEDNASGKGIKYVRVGIEGLTPAGGDR